MAEVVYILCMLTSAACAFLLLRSYRAARTQLLLWSSFCFVGLALNNALLFLDLVVLGPSPQFAVVRNLIALAALMTLIFGLVRTSE